MRKLLDGTEVADELEADKLEVYTKCPTKYKLVDMETGEEVRLNPEQYKKELAKELTKRVTDLKVKCGQYKIDFVEVDINKSFDEVLLPFLIKRKKLF